MHLEEYFAILLFLIQAKTAMNAETNVTINCTDLLNDFAQAASDFTLCSVKKSRPITMCEECVDAYIQVLDTFHNMSEFSDNGTLCIDYFINLDRLQIVETIHRNCHDLWSRAKCYECYTIDNSTMKKTNETIAFTKYYKIFWECTKNSEPENLCPSCMDDYLVLSDYYSSISNANEKIGVCMDLVDLMNGTWTFWSEKCCHFRKHDETVFIATSVMVLVMTASFYVISRFAAKKKIPTVMQQRRLAASLSTLST